MTATTLLARLKASSLLPALVLAVASRTGAQAVAPAITYVREHWTVADGLPINSITSLVQTRDGYLWLGTNDGVVRFDGVRFTVYNAGNTRRSRATASSRSMRTAPARSVRRHVDS